MKSNGDGWRVPDTAQGVDFLRSIAVATTRDFATEYHTCYRECFVMPYVSREKEYGWAIYFGSIEWHARCMFDHWATLERALQP